MAQLIDPSRTYDIALWDAAFDAPEEITGGDWAMVEGGPALKAAAAIATAVLLQLFTDRRAPDDYDLPGDDGDRRGWWADYVDIDETLYEDEMGSLIWIYERSKLNQEVVDNIVREAKVALQVLIDQGVFASTTVEAEWSSSGQYVYLDINGYSQDGNLSYSQRFHRLWEQAHPGLLRT